MTVVSNKYSPNVAEVNKNYFKIWRASKIVSQNAWEDTKTMIIKKYWARSPN